MDPVGMTFLALLGVVVAGAWVSFGGKPARPAPPRHRAVSTPAALPDQPAVLRVSRRGFGSNLARHAVRPRRWSAFVYAGMWSELHR